MNYEKPDWKTEREEYSIRQNGLGSYWPLLQVKTTHGQWCPIIIRDSNPFKTLGGAIRFVEKVRARAAKKASVA